MVQGIDNHAGDRKRGPRKDNFIPTAEPDLYVAAGLKEAVIVPVVVGLEGVVIVCVDAGLEDVVIIWMRAEVTTGRCVDRAAVRGGGGYSTVPVS